MVNGIGLATRKAKESPNHWHRSIPTGFFVQMVNVPCFMPLSVMLYPIFLSVAVRDYVSSELVHIRSRFRLRLIWIQITDFCFSVIDKGFKISQQTASATTKERFLNENSANFPKMSAIQTEVNSFLNSPTLFEKVGPTISTYFSSARACAWGDIVPLMC